MRVNHLQFLIVPSCQKFQISYTIYTGYHLWKIWELQATPDCPLQSVQVFCSIPNITRHPSTQSSTFLKDPALIKVHTSVHSPKNDRPSSSPIFRIAGPFKMFSANIREQYVLDSKRLGLHTIAWVGLQIILIRILTKSIHQLFLTLVLYSKKFNIRFLDKSIFLLTLQFCSKRMVKLGIKDLTSIGIIVNLLNERN